MAKWRRRRVEVRRGVREAKELGPAWPRIGSRTRTTTTTSVLLLAIDTDAIGRCDVTHSTKATRRLRRDEVPASLRARARLRVVESSPGNIR